MFHPARILVAVDFGGSARRALTAAATLARTHGAALDVLHVYEPPYYAPEALVTLPGQGPMPLGDYVKTTAEAQMSDFTAPLKADSALHGRMHAHVVPRLPFQEIPRHARSTGADLIVLGTHGRRGFAHVLLGSVAERVVRDAPCPLMIVREAGSAEPLPKRLDRVLVPVDFGPDSGVAVKTALDFVGGRVEALNLVNVVAVPAYTGDVMVPRGSGLKLAQVLHDDALTELRGFAEAHGVQGAALHVLQGSASEGLVRLATEDDAQLVVMGTRGRHGLAHYFVGSVAERVLRYSPCPVVVVRAMYGA